MKLSLLTLSTLLAVVFAAPATDLVNRQETLIFYTFKDITYVAALKILLFVPNSKLSTMLVLKQREIYFLPIFSSVHTVSIISMLTPCSGNTWSLYCKSGQSVEEILGDIPGGPYTCGLKTLIFYQFKDST
jgi:hypothetical protein